MEAAFRRVGSPRSMKINKKTTLFGLLLLLFPLAALSAGTTPRSAYLEYHVALKSGLSVDAIWPYSTKAAKEQLCISDMGHNVGKGF